MVDELRGSRFQRHGLTGGQVERQADNWRRRWSEKSMYPRYPRAKGPDGWPARTGIGVPRGRHGLMTGWVGQTDMTGHCRLSDGRAGRALEGARPCCARSWPARASLGSEPAAPSQTRTPMTRGGHREGRVVIHKSGPNVAP